MSKQTEYYEEIAREDVLDGRSVEHGVGAAFVTVLDWMSKRKDVSDDLWEALRTYMVEQSQELEAMKREQLTTGHCDCGRCEVPPEELN